MENSKNIELQLGELVLLWQLLLTERKRIDEKISGQVIPLESSYEQKEEITKLFHKINGTITDLID